MADVFISYSTADASDVDYLARTLIEAGLVVWHDRTEIAAGDGLVAQVYSAIWSSRVLVVVLTPRSVASSWVLHELQAARLREIEQRDVTLIPVMLESCDIPEPLRD